MNPIAACVWCVCALLFQPTAPTPVVTGSPAAVEPKPEPKAVVKLTVTVDAEEAPDLKEWGEQAKKVCEAWYPEIVEELRSEGVTPRDTVVIEFKKKMGPPASAGGGTINVSAEYVRAHRDDLGMMVHELTHIVQEYPEQKEDLGWLTEGIADYVRFWKYEPQVRQGAINKEKASYRDAYRTTAAFLGWMTEKHDKQIVLKLNAKLRKGEGERAMFKELTGKTVDELWAEFIAAGAPASPKLEKAEKTPAPGDTAVKPSSREK